MVSAYPIELYDRTLADWHRVTFIAPSRSGPRQEALWMNFTPGGPLHDTRFLGDTFRQREALTRQRKRWTDRLRRMPKPQQQAILTSLLAAFNADLPSGGSSDLHFAPDHCPLVNRPAAVLPKMRPCPVPSSDSDQPSA